MSEKMTHDYDRVSKACFYQAWKVVSAWSCPPLKMLAFFISIFIVVFFIWENKTLIGMVTSAVNVPRYIDIIGSNFPIDRPIADPDFRSRPQEAPNTVNVLYYSWAPGSVRATAISPCVFTAERLGATVLLLHSVNPCSAVTT